MHDVPTLRRVLLVFGAVIVLFFLHDTLHVSPSMVALGGAAAGLILIRPDVEQALDAVEWSVLLFFMALFVVVGGLKAAGVLESLGDAVATIAQENLLAATLGMLWVAAIASFIVDNIPFTVAMVPVIENPGDLGVATSPLWWALVFGAGFGGNGTPIGSTANVVMVTVSERTATPITTLTWIKSGSLVMLITTAIGSLAMWGFFDLFQTP